MAAKKRKGRKKRGEIEGIFASFAFFRGHLQPANLVLTKNKVSFQTESSIERGRGDTARANAVKGRVIRIDDTENSALRAHR